MASINMADIVGERGWADGGGGGGGRGGGLH